MQVLITEECEVDTGSGIKTGTRKVLIDVKQIYYDIEAADECDDSFDFNGMCVGSEITGIEVVPES